MNKIKKVAGRLTTGVVATGVILAPIICLASCSSTINTKEFVGFPNSLKFIGTNSSGKPDITQISTLPKGTIIQYTVESTEPYVDSVTTFTPPTDLWNDEQLTLKLVGANGERVTDSHAKTYAVTDLPPSNNIYEARSVKAIIPLSPDQLKKMFIYKTISLPNNKVLSFYSNGPEGNKGGFLTGSYNLDPKVMQIQYTVDSLFGHKLVTPTSIDPNIDLSKLSDNEYILKNRHNNSIVPWLLELNSDGTISNFQPLSFTPSIDFSDTQWISSSDIQQGSSSVLIKTPTALYKITKDSITSLYSVAEITIPPLGGETNVNINCKPTWTTNGNLLFNITIEGASKLVVANIDRNNIMTWVQNQGLDVDKNLSEIQKLSDNTYIGVSKHLWTLSGFVVSLYLIKVDSATSQVTSSLVAPKPYLVLGNDIKTALPDTNLAPTDFKRVNDNFGLFTSPEGIYAISLTSDGSAIYQDNSGNNPSPYPIYPMLYSLDITFVKPSIYLLSGLSPILDGSGKLLETREIIQVIKTC